MLRAPVERQMNGADKLKTVSWIQSGEGSVIFNRAILFRSLFRKLEDNRLKGKQQESRHLAVEILHLCSSDKRKSSSSLECPKSDCLTIASITTEPLNKHHSRDRRLQVESVRSQ